MAVYHADLVPKLIKYQKLIARLFTIHGFSRVVDYDVQFRKKLAVNPYMIWDRVDEETFSTTLRGGFTSGSTARDTALSSTASSTLRRRQVFAFGSSACYKCRGVGHYA